MQEKNIREKSQKENESRKKEYSASMKDTVLYAWKATIPIMAGYIVLENVIPFKTTGIDFAMTALFLTILIDQWESVKEHKPALTGILISLVVVFQKRTPESIVYLGEVLPYAVMGMLVMYCLRSTKFLSGNHGIPEVVSCVIVFVLHKWKHNTLLSILAGTVCYMLLVQNL